MFVPKTNMESEDWEHSKENVLPLKSGRKLAVMQATSEQQVRDVQREFETELRLYNGQDELSVWYRYIQWVEQTFPKGGPDGNLPILLKKCINRFLKDVKYKDDERYIDCWMKFLRYAPNHLDVFNQMDAYEIGHKSAAFYKAWAWYLEQLGNFRRANSILQEGMGNNAQPFSVLEDAQKQLNRRLIQQFKASHDNDEEPIEDQRQPLGGLKSIGKKHAAPISRIGDAKICETTRLPMQNLNIGHTTKNLHFQVYEEDNIQVSTGKQNIKPLSSIATTDWNSENNLKPAPWNKMKLKQNPTSAGAIQSTPQFTVLEIPNECLESGRKIMSGFAQVFTHLGSKVKSGFIEVQDPKRVYMCDIQKLYGGGVEFQAEEIAAARWYKNEKKRKEHEHKLQLERELELLKAGTRGLALKSEPHYEVAHGTKGLFERPTTVGPIMPCEDQQPQNTVTTRAELSNVTRDVLAFWDGTLNHPSREEISGSSNASHSTHSGIKTPASFHKDEIISTFQIYVDDQENLRKNANEVGMEDNNIKENIVPNDYTQEKSPRSESGNILQPSKREFVIFQDDDDDIDDDNIGIRPLPDENACHTLGPLPSQYNFFISEKCTSTPCHPSNYRHSEIAIELKPSEPLENKSKGLAITENLSTIIEASREGSKSSSGSSMASSLAQSTRRITSSTQSLCSHSTVQPPIVDPFDKKVLANWLHFVNFECIDGFHRVHQSLPKLSSTSTLKIGETRFIVDHQLAVGGEGVVFKGTTDDKNQQQVVLKVLHKITKPLEFYACSEIHNRLKDIPHVPDVRHSINSFLLASTYNNGTILVSEFSSIGTILDVSNFYRKTGQHVPEDLVLYFTWEMLEIIKLIHACKFVHADLKPDNFIVVNLPTAECLNQNFKQTTCLRLIDFGQAIDLQLYPNGTTFKGSVKTEDFACSEMLEGKPWVFQPDYYGLLGTIHTLLFPDYMAVHKVGDSYAIKNKFKRYWKTKFWETLFNTLLNVPNCEAFPDLTVFTRDLENRLNSTSMRNSLIDVSTRFFLVNNARTKY